MFYLTRFSIKSRLCIAFLEVSHKAGFIRTKVEFWRVFRQWSRRRRKTQVGAQARKMPCLIPSVVAVLTHLVNQVPGGGSPSKSLKAPLASFWSSPMCYTSKWRRGQRTRSISLPPFSQALRSVILPVAFSLFSPTPFCCKKFRCGAIADSFSGRNGPTAGRV